MSFIVWALIYTDHSNVEIQSTFILMTSFQGFQVCPFHLPEEGNLAKASFELVLWSLGTEVQLQDVCRRDYIIIASFSAGHLNQIMLFPSFCNREYSVILVGIVPWGIMLVNITQGHLWQPCHCKGR